MTFQSQVSKTLPATQPSAGYRKTCPTNRRVSKGGGTAQRRTRGLCTGRGGSRSRKAALHPAQAPHRTLGASTNIKSEEIKTSIHSGESKRLEREERAVYRTAQLRRFRSDKDTNGQD